MGLFQLSQYLKYLALYKSTKGHGIHYPFVYNLVTKVLPDKKEGLFNDIEKLRIDLLKNNSVVHITDLGAGSRKLKSTTRSIQSIAQTSLKTPKYARLIARLANHQKSKTIIELGTSLGITTAYLANFCNKVITIEGCPNIAEIANSNFKKLNLQHVEVKIGNFDDLLMPVLNQTTDCTLVFIDGNHTYESTMRYYYQLRKTMPNNSLLIFDDIYWSEGMALAWNKIISESVNQITIDLFQIGLVYLTNSQAPENFRIRI